MPEPRKLTKRSVDALEAKASGKDETFFDDEIRGFGVRVKPSGAKSYILKYRNRFGQQRKFHIARVGDITPDQARSEAKKLRGRIAAGHDPVMERDAERNAMTVAQLCDDYLEAAKSRIKASTWVLDQSRIECHVKPLLGSRPVANLRPSDIERFLNDVATGKTAAKPPAKGRGKRARGGVKTGGLGAASRTVSMLGTILQRAVRESVISTNPVRGVKRPKDEPKHPPFSFDLVKAVGTAMKAAMAEEKRNPEGVRPATETALRAIRFLMLSGCRRSEALTLQWGDVDFGNRCIRFRDTKTGKQVRPCGRAALDHLAHFKPKSVKPADYVFPGFSDETGHFVGLPRAWWRIAERAEIGDISLHGLRHWYATAAAEMNFSELTIAGLLGHKVRGVTARYANTPDSALAAAADRVSLRLDYALDGKAAEKVVSIAR